MRKGDMLVEDANARKNRIQNADMAARTRGNPAGFTAKENADLRAILKQQYDALRGQKRVSNQTQLGELIGVSQQTAQKLMSGTNGFSRPSALRLAHLCGYDSPETMLREFGGESAAPAQVPSGWAMRDLALRVAASLGYDDAVIERVRQRYTESRYASLPARWWNDRIVTEQRERDADAEIVAPASSATGPAELIAKAKTGSR